MKRPPSTILKEKFDKLTSYPPPESVCSGIAKETLLSVNDVNMWFEHSHTIKENRRRSAAKVAETRKRKKAGQSVKTTYYCAVCYQEYQEFT